MRTKARISEVKSRLPEPISADSFTTGGEKYTILRFSEGEGPTFTQTIAIAKSRGAALLTKEEINFITAPTNSQDPVNAFKTALRLGEWGFIRDQVSEEQDSRTEYLISTVLGGSPYLEVKSFDKGRQAARVVILRETAPAKAAAEAQRK